MEGQYYIRSSGSDMGAWSGMLWFRTGAVAASCKRSNEPSGSIKLEKFLD